ncbi:Aromatic amino acid aminotransferase [Smittium mucronatum]|uniref:Aromatic amino acid aminotransferase n=1 Tax=Smittium mucronatum TaxID=133383 RepID=A0A1R0GTA9_9FUNG|nr:Aromatic amino acid aminotransferase [Smittium mucronatum]
MTVLNAPVDFSGYMTERAKRRQKSPLKSLIKYIFMPDMVSLGGGCSKSTSEDGVEEGDLLVLTREGQKESSVEPLDRLLQYGGGLGIKSMMDFFTQHMEQIHSPKYEGWSIVPSVGSTDALGKAIDLFANEGDPILVAEWTYPTAIETIHQIGLEFVTVQIDSEGMIPSSLDHVCTNWSGSSPLRLIYVIPTGQNPTGATMSLSRRTEFYKVCQKHDLIIIEDDPYYFLQFANIPVVDSVQETQQLFPQLPGIHNLVPSLLSLDTDGRVIRLDTFSKLLAPNLRYGWITAQFPLIEKIMFHNENSVQQPSGFTQGLSSKLLTECWGPSGFLEHVLFLQKEYLVRRNALVSSIQKHVGNMVSLTIPTSGMFVWLKINLSPSQLATPGIMDQIFESMVSHNVLLVPGCMFSPVSDNNLVKDEPYLRAAFSYTTLDQLEDSAIRLAAALSSFGLSK